MPSFNLALRRPDELSIQHNFIDKCHDHAVSVVRMYFQMIVVGLILAVVLYAALMAGFLSHYVAASIPEIRTINGQPHLAILPRAGRLPAALIQ